MQGKPKKKTNEKVTPRRKLKLGRVIGIIGIIIYFIMFINAFFGQLLKTQITNYEKIEDSDSVTGYIIRMEQIIASNLPGNLNPVKNEGDRVAKGSVIATILKQSTEDVEKKIADVDTKIEGAIKEQENNKLGTLFFSDDIVKIDSDNDKKVSELCRLINKTDFSEVARLKVELDDNLRKRAEISGKLGPASQYIESLKSQKASYENNMSALKENIRADFPGVVSYNIDGLENTLVPSCIPSLNIRQLTSLCNNELNNKIVNKFNAIKIVDNFECYIATIVENKEKINEIKKGTQKAWIRFQGSGDALVPATIENISVEDGNKALVTFKINEKVENLINCRKINIDIVWSTSKGLKIPLSSVVKQMIITTVIKDKNEVKPIKAGEDVLLKITGLGDKPVPATVYSNISDKNGQAIIKFKLSKKIKTLMKNTEISVDVEWLNHNDEKFPKALLAKSEEINGVFVVDANYTKFQEIEIIDQNNEYAIVNEVSLSSNKGLSLYDEIVVNGSNVEEGRQVRKWDF